MKKVVFLFVLIISSFSLLSEEVRVKSELVSSKVYLSGAELSHSANTTVKAGMTDIVIEGLATELIPNSIQANLDGKAMIISVVSRVNYLNQQNKPKKAIELEDSVKLLNYKIAQENNARKALSDELNMILANKIAGTPEKGSLVSELKLLSDFYRTRIPQINQSILDIDENLKTIQTRLNLLSAQLSEFYNQMNKPTSEIVITVLAKSQQEVGIKLNYLIYKAGWMPIYDIRSENINSPVVLNYKANVWQNSGFDWDDIKISLSTRNPFVSGSKPVLMPWFVRFAYRYENRKREAEEYDKAVDVKTARVPSPVAVTEGGTRMDSDDMPGSLADQTSVKQSELNAEFEPQIKYSIPSDNKYHLVALQDYEIPAKYEYYAAPKLDLSAFLVAYLTGWGDYNLLPGTANVYFEGGFVGTTNLNPNLTKDTLEISMGRDKNIILERKVLKDFTEDKFLSKDIERQFAYEFSIRNNKKAKITILIEENYPISTHEDIEVNLTESSGAALDKSLSKLGWKIELEPAKEAKRKLIWSIRYPGDKSLDNFFE